MDNNGYGYNQNQGYYDLNYQNQGYNQGYQNQNYQVQPVRGWNWGAFMFTFVWGIANGCWQPFLVFVPLLNIIWPFVCGFKGHTWAMKSGTWRTVEEYNAVMKSWNRAGLANFIVCIVLCLISFIFMSSVIMAVIAAVSDLAY